MSSDYVKRKRTRSDIVRMILLILTAVVSCALGLIIPFEEDAERSYNSDALEGWSGILPQERANYCRDYVYSDLCMIGTIYLNNCTNGRYHGTPELYENMLEQLSWFDTNNKNENMFGLQNSASQRGLKINQSQYNITSMDSDYFYFFVRFGNEYLTNISAYRNLNVESLATVTDELCKQYPDWHYLRENNKIYSVSEYDESGLGKREVYYTIADGDGGTAITSEYIDSDKLLFGAAGVDNYGNYTLCFDNLGDRTIRTYTGNSVDEYIGSYYQLSDDCTQLKVYREQIVEYSSRYELADTYGQGSLDYIKAVNLHEGVYSVDNEWIEIKELPDYTFNDIDTSRLTIFMAPKQDLVSTSASFINRYHDNYTVFHWVRIALFGAWAALGTAVLIMTIARPARSYERDVDTIKDKVFRLDLSAICIIVFMTLISYILYTTRIYLFSESNISYAVIAVLTLIISHVMVYLSFESYVRHIKLNGIKSKPKLIITSLWKESKTARRDISEKISNNPIVKWHRGLRIGTRYAIMNIELIVVALLALVAAFFSHYDDYGNFLEFSWPFVLLFILLGIRYLIVTMRLVHDLSKIEKQTDDMFLPEHEKQQVKPLSPTSPLSSLSNKLDEVSERAKDAVEQQVKSEKMKVELVTNVSHDLKTPLTSIISYIDLLEKTDLSDEARGYVMILSRKSGKLRDIVQDVFSLAKAVSDIDIELDMIDLAILTRQVIGDNTDNIESSGKELRTDIKPETARISADGPKLYRVIQNLLDNALKYSMPGTRIYLTLEEHENDFELSIKNVSETEMNFTAEEITERFARGDESRTDGGSGLGLSIAQSFTEACGGRFGVEIDGDVFRATVSFDRYEPDSSEPDSSEPEESGPIIDSSGLSDES